MCHDPKFRPFFRIVTQNSPSYAMLGQTFWNNKRRTRLSRLIQRFQPTQRDAKQRHAPQKSQANVLEQRQMNSHQGSQGFRTPGMTPSERSNRKKGDQTHQARDTIIQKAGGGAGNARHSNITNSGKRRTRPTKPHQSSSPSLRAFR